MADALYKLSQEERDDLAAKLVNQFAVTDNVRMNLKTRWDRCEGIYFADNSATSFKTVAGINTYPFSIMRGKLDGIEGKIVQAIFDTDPPVQCIEQSPEGTNEAPLEKALSQLSEACGLQRAFPKAVHQALITNLGALRIKPKWIGETFDGLETDWFSPLHFMAYPISKEYTSECLTHGNRFYQGAWDIDAKVATGQYYKGISITTNDDPDQWDRLPGKIDRNNDNSVLTTQDGYVECFEVITKYRKHKKGDAWGTPTGKWVDLICTVARSQQVLLSAREYVEPRSFYSILRLCRNEKRIFCNDSVANSIQGYCLGVQDLMNAIIGGFYMTAYGCAWVEGSFAGSQAITLKPGSVVQLQPGQKMGALEFDFNPQAAVGVIEMFQQLIDATTGQSRVASSQSVPTDTKATTINALTAADQQRQGNYLDAISEGVEDLFRILFMYLREYHEELGMKYGGAIAALDPELLQKEYKFVVSGRTGSGSPQVLGQKLTMLMQMASNPMSTLDYGKVEVKAVDAMDLPFNSDNLEKDELTMWRQVFEEMRMNGLDPMAVLEQGLADFEAQANAQAAVNGDPEQPGMEANQGVPQGPGEPTAGGAPNVQPGGFGQGPGSGIDIASLLSGLTG